MHGSLVRQEAYEVQTLRGQLNQEYIQHDGTHCLSVDSWKHPFLLQGLVFLIYWVES